MGVKFSSSTGKVLHTPSGKVSFGCSDPDACPCDVDCMTVTLPAMSDGECLDCNCGSQDVEVVRTGECHWHATFPENGCRSMNTRQYHSMLSLDVAYILDGSDWIVRITLATYVIGQPSQQTIWEYNFGTSKPDCDDINGATYSRVSQSANSPCTTTGSVSLTTNDGGDCDLWTAPECGWPYCHDTCWTDPTDYGDYDFELTITSLPDSFCETCDDLEATWALNRIDGSCSNTMYTFPSTGSNPGCDLLRYRNIILVGYNNLPWVRYESTYFSPPSFLTLFRGYAGDAEWSCAELLSAPRALKPYPQDPSSCQWGNITGTLQMVAP